MNHQCQKKMILSWLNLPVQYFTIINCDLDIYIFKLIETKITEWRLIWTRYQLSSKVIDKCVQKQWSRFFPTQISIERIYTVSSVIGIDWNDALRQWFLNCDPRPSATSYLPLVEQDINFEIWTQFLCIQNSGTTASKIILLGVGLSQNVKNLLPYGFHVFLHEQRAEATYPRGILITVLHRCQKVLYTMRHFGFVFLLIDR